MSTLKKTSGKECLKILCNKFGFQIRRQRGSHVVLRKETTTGAIGTVVPMHQEIKLPTLKNVLRLARIEEEDFAKYQ